MNEGKGKLGTSKSSVHGIKQLSHCHVCDVFCVVCVHVETSAGRTESEMEVHNIESGGTSLGAAYKDPVCRRDASKLATFWATKPIQLL